MSSFINSMVQTNNEFNQALGQQKGSALDKDAFMLLLVTQFKYQDPLNPAEDKEFIAQLAQFSSLEQLMNLNEGMEGLTSASLQGQMINATSYIGKTVDATGTNISKTTTNKDKNEFSVSSFRYAIGEAAQNGTIRVLDGSGSIVNSYEQPPRGAGTYTFEWDGKTTSGAYAPDGVYRIVPSFTNAEGKPITDYDAVVDGKVASVVTESGVTYLTLEDGRTVPLANVRRVSEVKVTSGDKNEADLVKTTTNADTNEYTLSTFRYTIEEGSAHGEIRIYDKTEKLVNTYSLAAQSSGSYPFQWDGKDASGNVVPDGVYTAKPSITNSAGKLIPCKVVVDGSAKYTGGSGTDTPAPPAETGDETARAA